MSGQKRKASGSTCGCLTDHKTKAEYEQQALPDGRQAITEGQVGCRKWTKFGLGFPQGNGSPPIYPESTTPKSKALKPQLDPQHLSGPQPCLNQSLDTTDGREAEKTPPKGYLDRVYYYASKIYDPDSAAVKFLDKKLEDGE